MLVLSLGADLSLFLALPSVVSGDSNDVSTLRLVADFDSSVVEADQGVALGSGCAPVFLGDALGDGVPGLEVTLGARGETRLMDASVS